MNEKEQKLQISYAMNHQVTVDYEHNNEDKTTTLVKVIFSAWLHGLQKCIHSN